MYPSIALSWIFLSANQRRRSSLFFWLCFNVIKRWDLAASRGEYFETCLKYFAGIEIVGATIAVSRAEQKETHLVITLIGLV